ncbi:MAG: hypothetical protein Q4G08_05595 [Capnocytophaga sp.]|nr:hypothetical protein [Capnocytophaga sp.]
MKFFENRLKHAWYSVAFVFLLLGTIPGLLMRWGFLYGMPLPFGNMLHAHSHVLVLSWLNLMGVGLLCRLQNVSLVRLRIFFWIQVVAGVAMFGGFLYQGYGALSIVASCLQMTGNFYITWVYFRKKYFQRDTFVSTALWFNLLSVIGIIGIAPAILLAGRDSNFFRLSVEFFLHFQIQGWLLTLWAGLIVRYLGIRLLRWQYILWTASVILTFGISANYRFPNDSWLIINGIGVVLQFIFTVLFFKKTYHLTSSWLIRITLVSFLAKAVMPILTLTEPQASWALSQRDIVLFYLHWVLIGIVMIGFLGIFQAKHRWFRWGIHLFMLGYFFTELILLAGGFPQWVPSSLLLAKYAWLAYSSTIMVSGIVIMTLDRLKLALTCKSDG